MITLIGMGSGTPGSLTAQGLAALQGADRILGAKRLLATLPEGCTGNRQALYKPDEILACLAAHPDEEIALVYSGDTGFYSGASQLLPMLRAFGISCRVLPGLSSVQLLAAAVGRPWQDWTLVSAHGCACDPVSACMNHKTVFFLTGGAETPATLCAALTAAGLGDAHALVGENLGTPDEKIHFGTAQELAGQTFASLSVLLVEHAVHPERRTPGLPDEVFIRGEVPMTKQEVRAAALAKLAVRPADTLWDVGAGTGPHVPQGVGGAHGQFGQRGGPHFLLGHGHLAPDEDLIRQAGGAAFRVHGMFHQQDAQGSKGLPGQFLRGAKVDLFVRRAKVFAHKGVGIAQPGGGQRGTQGGRGLGPAGEKEYGFMVHAGGHRVAGTAVGRNKSPVLPGAAYGGGQQLYAGKAGQNPAGDAKGPQHGQQLGCAGVEPGIAAVHQRNFLVRVRGQTGQNFVRFVQGLPVSGAALRQCGQQPLCAQNAVGTLQGGKTLCGQAAGGAGAHTNECDHPFSTSLQRVRICSAVSPVSAGRRITMSWTPVSAAACAFSAKPPAAPPSLVTRKRMENCSSRARFSA